MATILQELCSGIHMQFSKIYNRQVWVRPKPKGMYHEEPKVHKQPFKPCKIKQFLDSEQKRTGFRPSTFMMVCDCPNCNTHYC